MSAAKFGATRKEIPNISYEASRYRNTLHPNDKSIVVLSTSTHICDDPTTWTNDAPFRAKSLIIFTWPGWMGYAHGGNSRDFLSFSYVPYRFFTVVPWHEIGKETNKYGKINMVSIYHSDYKKMKSQHINYSIKPYRSFGDKRSVNTVFFHSRSKQICMRDGRNEVE